LIFNALYFLSTKASQHIFYVIFVALLNFFAMTTQQYITVKELCEWIRLSRSKVYSLISTKEIPHIKVGGKILFDKEKIQNWIDSQSK
jgi:excisionase family DNA binding protein